MAPSRYQIKMRGKVFQAKKAGGQRPEMVPGTQVFLFPKG